MSVRIGVSGWSYPHWRGDFYPAGLPHRSELAHVAARLGAAEVNATFYRLQRPATYARWAAETPDGFRFALKGPRLITHLKALHDVRLPLADFLASGPLLLGPKLGPLLWQLPAAARFDAERLDELLALLPHDTGAAAVLAAGHDEHVEGRAWFAVEEPHPLCHVLEPRDPGFGSPEALALLRSHDVGLVVSDSAGAFPRFTDVTSDVVYVRLHGPDQLYRGGYSDALLDAWAERVRSWADEVHEVWVFFDNDGDGRAPYDAIALSERLGDLLAPTGGST